MKELSPAAQAVLDAVEDDCVHPTDLHRIGAAAIRAAVVQGLMKDVPPHVRDCAYWPWRNGRDALADFFEDIAAELDSNDH